MTRPGRSGSPRKLCPAAPDTTRRRSRGLGPVGMIFIPSIGGISHSPKEFSRPQDIENGANVLLQTCWRSTRHSGNLPGIELPISPRRRGEQQNLAAMNADFRGSGKQFSPRRHGESQKYMRNPSRDSIRSDPRLSVLIRGKFFLPSSRSSATPRLHGNSPFSDYPIPDLQIARFSSSSVVGVCLHNSSNACCRQHCRHP